MATPEEVMAEATEAAYGSMLNELLPSKPRCAICGAENARFMNVTVEVFPDGVVTPITPFVPVCGDHAHKSG